MEFEFHATVSVSGPVTASQYWVPETKAGKRTEVRVIGALLLLNKPSEPPATTKLSRAVPGESPLSLFSETVNGSGHEPIEKQLSAISMVLNVVLVVG